ncbi:MAG: hypothetical protein ACI9RM_002156, partial [Ulvibacter sp.]
MAFIACKDKNTDLIALNTEVNRYIETDSLDIKVADLLAKMTL